MMNHTREPEKSWGNWAVCCTLSRTALAKNQKDRAAFTPHRTSAAWDYLDEMAVFVWDEFNLQVTTSSISRVL